MAEAISIILDFVDGKTKAELEYDDRFVYVDPTLYDMMGSECTTEVNKCQ